MAVTRTPAAIGERELTAISRIASAASSGGSVQDRVNEILDQLRELIPIAGAMISYVDPTRFTRRPITVYGYSDRLAEYLNGSEYHAEVIGPYALPAAGWPVRERDLPIDPLSLRCVTEYFLPEGLVQGLNSALVTSDGRYVGFLDISDCDSRHPSDAACAVVGHIAPALANVVDPLQSARSLVSTLDENCVALGLMPDGRTVPLQGSPGHEFVEAGTRLHQAVTSLLGERLTTTAFLWPRVDGGWFGCRAFRCPDHLAVVTVRDLGSPYDLTARELEVLTRLIDGHSNAVIARELRVTTRTVKAHVEHVLEKLDVPTRGAAIGRATQEGLLLPPSNGNGRSANAG